MVSESSPDELHALDSLLAPIDKDSFQRSICRLQTLYTIYANTSPAPLPAPGLIITPEIRHQCERYLPIADIAAIFNRLYSSALTYSPILSSTPFHGTLSWADTFALLPTCFQQTPNPAQLLELLVNDTRQLTIFLFASFLPDRFYGRFGRYPGQQMFIRKWLHRQKRTGVTCLDAACGCGDGTYSLALLLSECGLLPERISIEGWTLEPLEVWAAKYRRFPHNQLREAMLRNSTATLLGQGYCGRISFHCQNIMKPDNDGQQKRFALVLCNGLLGGPIVYKDDHITIALDHLTRQLEPGGVLLIANHFHGGWKQRCPQKHMRALLEKIGLTFIEAGEGYGGLKPDQ